MTKNKRQKTTDEKQRQARNKDKWLTMTIDKQEIMTINKQQQRPNANGHPDWPASNNII